MRTCVLLLLAALLVVPVGKTGNLPDDDDKTPAWQQRVRRLHPERERAKAMKKLQEQMSQRAQDKADPWDTDDEVWGTVDVPHVAVRDSDAVEGYRLGDSPDDGAHRLMWRDEPVMATVDQLMPYFAVTGEGECRSKYVLADSTSTEIYFAFDVNDSLPGPLRLCVRYCADSKVDFDQITFTIDGYDYFFYPFDPQSWRLSGGKYLASCYEVLKAGYKDLVYALAHGRWVMLKLQGTGGVSRVKVLTDGQREDFRHTLDLYQLLGGEI